MIISTAYSGNLVSFMTIPKLTSPINTLEEVLKSGLPWEMVVYGVEVEDAMASGALGSIVKKLWEGKIPRDYSPTPQVCIIMIKNVHTFVILLLPRCKMCTRGNQYLLTTSLA